MAYNEFTLSGVARQFSLTVDQTRDLYSQVAPLAVSDVLQAMLVETVPLALIISSEKARSELIIAPILLELWRIMGKRLGLFSGVEFNIDASKGLNGVCDFILTHAPDQPFVSAPVVMLVEAKNEDMKKGYGQCLAEMVAAQEFNRRDGIEGGSLYGVVTTGNNWRFLQLEGDQAHIDRREYYIENVDHIMGILWHLTRPTLSEAKNG